MRRGVVITIIAVAVGLLTVPSIYFLNKQKQGVFLLEDYTSVMEMYKSDLTVGKITDVRNAKNEARKIFSNVFGDSKRNLIVMYDKSNDCWLVKEELPKNRMGGGANIIFHSEGKVLALWHEK